MADDQEKSKRRAHMPQLGERGFLYIFLAMLAAALVIRLTGWTLEPIVPINATNGAANVNAQPLLTKADVLTIVEQAGVHVGVRAHEVLRQSSEDGVHQWQIRQYATDTTGTLITISGTTGKILSRTTWETPE